MISRHPCNNDPRLYQFERNSRLPIDTFKERRKFPVDKFVMVLVVVLGLVAACVP